MNKFSVRGIQTSTVAVDISKQDVIEIVEKIFLEKYPQFKRGYIDKEGNWQLEDGYDHHKGDLIYTKGEAASSEDLTLNAHFSFIMSL